VDHKITTHTQGMPSPQQFVFAAHFTATTQTMTMRRTHLPLYLVDPVRTALARIQHVAVVTARSSWVIKKQLPHMRWLSTAVAAALVPPSCRDYLAQRHFSAVLYLNSKDADFSGGTFCFQSGSGPLRIEPSAGGCDSWNCRRVVCCLHE
jgi:hypothetical protein